MKCYKDEAELEPAVIDYEYRGVIVRGVKALRCPVCGEEIIPSEEVARIMSTIREAAQPLRLKRNISVAGRRPVVYLPEDVVKAVKVKVGDEVYIYTEGNRIIIEPV